ATVEEALLILSEQFIGNFVDGKTGNSICCSTGGSGIKLDTQCSIHIGEDFANRPTVFNDQAGRKQPGALDHSLSSAGQFDALAGLKHGMHRVLASTVFTRDLSHRCIYTQLF